MRYNSKINNQLKVKNMKRIILCLTVALSMFSFQAKAQWVVTDPTNLVQNIISATQGINTVSNMVRNVNEVKRCTIKAKNTTMHLNQSIT